MLLFGDKRYSSGFLETTLLLEDFEPPLCDNISCLIILPLGPLPLTSSSLTFWVFASLFASGEANILLLFCSKAVGIFSSLMF